MTKLYPNPCYNMACYKGTALYIVIAFFFTSHRAAYKGMYLSYYSAKQYSKTCLKRPLKSRPKIEFQDRLCLMQVKSIAERSLGSILQYFPPLLSYHLSLRSLICLFLSGHLRLV